MQNTANFKKKDPLFQRMAEFFFYIYLITLYIFVDKLETLAVSQVAFILYAGFTALYILQRKRIHLGKSVFVVYMTYTWMYTTTFWAANEYLAKDRMNTMWLIFLMFFLTYNLFCEREDSQEYLLKGLYIAGISLVIYSIYTYGFAAVIKMMSSQDVIRLGKEINQENTFGMMNATTVMIAFYYLFYKKKYKLFHIIVICVAFLFAMSSGSRKALLMMCIGVLYLVYKKYGVKQLYKLIAVGAALTLVFIAVIQLPMFDFITKRMDQAMELVSGNGEGESSARLRMLMIETGWKLFKERMLFGYGANNYCLVSGFGTYSHNNFIEVLVNFGLIGFVFYYFIYIIAIKRLLESKYDSSKAVFAIFLVKIMMEMALVSYYSKDHWIILAFSLMICSKVKDNDREEVYCEEIESTEENPIEKQEPEEVIYQNEEESEDDEESYYETEEGDFKSEVSSPISVSE